MNVSEICRTDVVTIKQDASICDAAKCMRDYNVGSLIVVEQENKAPIGIITDRDIVVKLLAEDKSIRDMKVSDIMSESLLVLHESEDMIDIIDAFCDKGVRRAPVVDDNNQVCGIVAADDILAVIADELSGMADLVKRQACAIEGDSNSNEHADYSERLEYTERGDINQDASDSAQIGDRSQAGGKREWGQVGDRYKTSNQANSPQTQGELFNAETNNQQKKPHEEWVSNAAAATGVNDNRLNPCSVKGEDSGRSQIDTASKKNKSQA
jgi:CBS domain-containing protein